MNEELNCEWTLSSARHCKKNIFWQPTIQFSEMLAKGGTHNVLDFEKGFIIKKKFEENQKISTFLKY